MTALECLQQARAAGANYQRVINTFVDEFRRASMADKRLMAQGPIEQSGQLEGLVAAVVSALCRECAVEAPGWVASVGSPGPFFAFPAKSYALRVRLMIESPPAFRVRNVFVPRDYLSRA
jgi:hypothetical protein